MNDHRWAVLRAWKRYGGRAYAFRRKSARRPSGPILGDPVAIREELERQVLRAATALQDHREKQLGLELWADFEEEVNQGLMETLELQVPMRLDETRETWHARLDRIARSYRVRLDTVPGLPQEGHRVPVTKSGRARPRKARSTG